MNLGPKMAEIRGKNRKPMKIDLPLYNSKICDFESCLMWPSFEKVKGHQNGNFSVTFDLI